MTLSIVEIKEAVLTFETPSFVKTVGASEHSFNTSPFVQRDYCLFVQLDRHERDPYTGLARVPMSNHPFAFPATLDELRAQVCAAILMAVAHETIEQVSDGGKHFCAPHLFYGRGDVADTRQWLWLLDSLHNQIQEYAATMTPSARAQLGKLNFSPRQILERS